MTEEQTKSTSEKEEKYDLPPRPSYTMSEIAKNLSSGQLPWFYLDCCKEVGNIFQLKFPMFTMIVCGDGKVQKQISEHSTTIKDINVYKGTNFLFNGNPAVLTTEGIEWKRRIKAVSPAFASTHIKRMNIICKEYIDKWKNEFLEGSVIKQNKSFDVTVEMERLTVQIISKAAFDYEMSNEDAYQYVYEMRIALLEYNSRMSVLTKMLFGSWFTKKGRRGIAATKYLYCVSKNVLSSYQANMLLRNDGSSKSSENNNNNDNTLINCIVNNTTYNNDEERAADITVFFLAGHDTTGNTLAWTLLELAKQKNSNVLMTLRKELSIVEPDQWSKTTALQNVIKESMRLNPVIAGGPVRLTGKDFIVKVSNSREDGSEKTMIIPKGTNVIMPNILSGRDPAIFDNPSEFIPSRWNDEDSNKKWNNYFFPFATGRHSCPGQALANAELHTIIPNIIMKYNLSIVDAGTASWEATTMKPIGTKLKASFRGGTVSN